MSCSMRKQSGPEFPTNSPRNIVFIGDSQSLPGHQGDKTPTAQADTNTGHRAFPQSANFPQFPSGSANSGCRVAGIFAWADLRG